jgi:hypothetical protein
LPAQTAVTASYAFGFALAARRQPILPELAMLWNGVLGWGFAFFVEQNNSVFKNSSLS